MSRYKGELLNMSKEEAMKILIEYCKNTECEKCIFAHTEFECGIHNPSCWEGINNKNE